MMQKMDYESEQGRTNEKQRRYIKLRQEYEDLKHELTLLVKERQAISAANREETYKKEEILIGLARQMRPGESVVFNIRQKPDSLTTESNIRMFSKDIFVMKPSYFNLISLK